MSYRGPSGGGHHTERRASRLGLPVSVATVVVALGAVTFLVNDAAGVAASVRIAEMSGATFLGFRREVFIAVHWMLAGALLTPLWILHWRERHLSFCDRAGQVVAGVTLCAVAVDVVFVIPGV